MASLGLGACGGGSRAQPPQVVPPATPPMVDESYYQEQEEPVSAADAGVPDVDPVVEQAPMVEPVEASEPRRDPPPQVAYDPRDGRKRADPPMIPRDPLPREPR